MSVPYQRVRQSVNNTENRWLREYIGGSLGSDTFSGKVWEPIRLLSHKRFRRTYGGGGGGIKKVGGREDARVKVGKMKEEGESTVQRHGRGEMLGEWRMASHKSYFAEQVSAAILIPAWIREVPGSNTGSKQRILQEVSKFFSVQQMKRRWRAQTTPRLLSSKLLSTLISHPADNRGMSALESYFKAPAIILEKENRRFFAYPSDFLSVT